MDQHQTKDWRELCKAAAGEPDPNKLMALVAEINKALDECDSRRNVNRGIEKISEANFSAPVSKKWEGTDLHCRVALGWQCGANPEVGPGFQINRSKVRTIE